MSLTHRNIEYDVKRIRELAQLYERQYQALSDDARRRVDNGPFCRVPIAGGDQVLEVFILGGPPTRRAVRHAIRWLESFLEDLPEEQPLEVASELPATVPAEVVQTSQPGGGSNEPGGLLHERAMAQVFEERSSP